MNPQTWGAVDDYLTDVLVKPDAALDTALKKSAAAGLPAISVTAAHGKLLHILALSIGAKRILEVGTLGGYSMIWLARALPADGKLVTLEIDPKHAEIAGQNLKVAGVADRVQIILGRGADSLAKLQAEKSPPFDLVFIDADKPSNADYFTAAMKLSHVGTLIIIDNVIRAGGVIDAASKDASVQGVRKLNEILSRDKRVIATAIQTVGGKGYDGFAIARVMSL